MRPPNDIKTRENLMRRKAARYGLRLIKSNRRDPDALDYGLFALVDPRTNGAINPALVGQFVCSWSLDQIEAYLTPTGDAPAPARKAMTA
jgi:hypothetical protein